MAWGTIRAATPTDTHLLEERAQSFLTRHSLSRLDEWQTAVDAVESYVRPDHEPDDPAYRSYLHRLWQRIVRRALAHPWAEGIAYGYVGYHCH